MPNKSKTTTTVSFRLPNEIVAIIDRRAKNNYWSRSQYLRTRVVYDITRKHIKHTKRERGNEASNL